MTEEQPHEKLLREIDERTRAAKFMPPKVKAKKNALSTKAKKPSWIRRNFFQTCVVLLLAWIGTNLELVVDARRFSNMNAIEKLLHSYVDVPVADDPPSLNDVERALGSINGKLRDIELNTDGIYYNTKD